MSFLQDSASELLYPILPFFLTVTLAAPVALVGFIEGLAEAVAAMTKVWSGRTSDRRRRRPLIGAGYGLAAVGKAVIAVAFAWPAVLAGRCLDRFGKGVRGAPRDSLLVDGIAPADRGKAFGLHRAADTAGAVVGPLIGLALYQLLGGNIRPLLVFAVVPATLSAFAVLLLREKPRAAVAARAATPAPSAAPLPAPLRRAIGLLGCFALVNTPDALLLLRASAIGLSVSAVILAYVFYNAVYAALSYPFGHLSDHYPPPRIIAFGLGCFALCYVGLGLTSSTALVWPLLAVYGAFTASTDGVGKAWISRLAPRDQQGRAQGLFQGVMSGGVLVAGLWAGLLWHGTGRLPLTLAGLGAAAVAVAVLLVPVEKPA